MSAISTSAFEKVIGIFSSSVLAHEGASNGLDKIPTNICLFLISNLFTRINQFYLISLVVLGKKQSREER